MMTNHIAFYQFCSAVRRKGALALCLALCMLGLGFAQDHKPIIITFDEPDVLAGTFTEAFNINRDGAIVGAYLDATTLGPLGFVRYRDGTFRKIDPKGTLGGVASAINPAGVIAGNWDNSTSGVTYTNGFVLEPYDKFTPFDVPGACQGLGKGTTAWAINPAGATTGYWIDCDGFPHGFVRDPGGRITPFDVTPTSPVVWTFVDAPNAINPDGTIVGWYYDANFLAHGFVRDPYGRITPFDVTTATPPDPLPGTTPETGQGTYATGINPDGAIIGYYIDSDYLYHGFLRDKHGKFTTFDVPVPTTSELRVASINAAGAITGFYQDEAHTFHGFVRDPDGKITTIDVTTATPPDPPAGTGAFQGTTAYAINDAGEITGWYVDVSGIAHGFLRIP